VAKGGAILALRDAKALESISRAMRSGGTAEWRFDRPMKVKSVWAGICGSVVLLGLASTALAA
jgi:hypothetical protein